MRIEISSVCLSLSVNGLLVILGGNALSRVLTLNIRMFVYLCNGFCVIKMTCRNEVVAVHFSEKILSLEHKGEEGDGVGDGEKTNHTLLS